MIKDRVFKAVLIPVFGVLIPLSTNLLTKADLGFIRLAFTLVFFVFLTHLSWQGAVGIISAVRGRAALRNNIYVKLAVLVFVTAMFGATAFFISAYFWQWIIWKQVSFLPSIKLAGIAALFMLLLTLIYETMFLSVEAEVDAKVMQQLDVERLQAEASQVKNELDPHFLFNCLNSLSYLIRNEPDRAYQFVHRFSNVCKYLLMNKQKELVSLADERQFVQDYYFLLQVRFDDAIQIKEDLTEKSKSGMIPPCTLQLLIDNAIKQNFFSEKEPLIITMQLGDGFVNFSNAIRPKPYKKEASDTSLSTLKTRLRGLVNEEVFTQRTADQFLVKIPLAQQQNVA